MKLLCILITLAFVNVSPIMTAHYANSVYITNQYIKEVSDTNPAGLETAISNIINGDKTIETVNLMLAVPEKAVFRITIDHDDTFIINLPENIAIRNQELVQEAISEATEIDVPTLGPNESYVNAWLGTLGDVRRSITGKITKKLLIEAIGDGKPDFPNFPKICLLIALVRSIRYPEARTRTVDVDPSGNFCILTSRDGRFKYQPYRPPATEEIQFPEKHIAAVRPEGPDVYTFLDVLDEIELWF
ncbi:uncharacterized protein LOC126842392 isoform X2 [Adelges cooleyi]|uniref:uncharacterized protein LOC126842392 isoform X2 n=1 Tax=Adelges cooleyi TaxID=133065 RepID=UPI00217F6FC3|nr:uncharacterized protein LOC126842392 isoform X2 [Adelges cooleyi]